MKMPAVLAVLLSLSLGLSAQAPQAKGQATTPKPTLTVAQGWNVTADKVEQIGRRVVMSKVTIRTDAGVITADEGEIPDYRTMSAGEIQLRGNVQIKMAGQPVVTGVTGVK